MKILKSLFSKIFKPIRLIIKEMKLVEWLSLSQTMKSTVLVLVISMVIGIIIVAFDIVFFDIRSVIIEL